MQAAITNLEISLEVLENNEPINRAEGNIAQADLELRSAEEIREGLAILRRAKAFIDAGLDKYSFS